MKRLLSIACCLLWLGSHAQDSSSLKRALTIYKSAGKEHKAQASEMLSNAFADLKDYPKALEYLEEARQVFLMQGDSQESKVLIPRIAAYHQQVRKTSFSFQALENRELVSESGLYSILKIDSVNKQLLIRGGTNDGIFPGASGSVHWIHKIHDESFLKIGQCVVTEVGPNQCIVSFELSGDKWPLPGDVIDIPSRIPKRPKQSVLLELALLRIGCKDREDALLYDSRQLLYGDDPVLEYQIIELMVEDIRQTAVEWEEFIREKKDFMKPRTKRRFKGMNLLEAMQRARHQDLVAFLLFVKNFPGKYIGVDWKINELYATWVINDGLPSKDEFIADLQEASSPADYKRIADFYAKEIREDEFMTYANLEGSDLARKNYHDLAVDLEIKILRLAQMMGDTDQIGWAHFGMARVYDIQEQNDSATYFYNKAIPFFQLAGDLKGEAFCKSNIGNFLRDDQDYKAARRLLYEAMYLKMQALEKDPTDNNLMNSLAISYAALAGVDKKLSAFDSAIYFYRQAASIYGADGDLEGRKDRASALQLIAKIYTQRGELEQALKLYREQEEVLLGLGEESLLADLYDDMAFTHYKLGDYSKAFVHYSKAFALKKENRLWSGAGFSLSSMGQMQWNLSNLDSAISLHKLAISYREKGNSESGKAYAYMKLGALYADIGQPQKTLDYYTKAADIYDKLKDLEEVANVQNKLATLYSEQKNDVKAEEYYLAARKAYEGLGMRQEVADITENIGILKYDQKKYEEARKYHLTSLAIRQEIGDRSGQMYSQSNLALINLYHDFDKVKASARMDTALQLARATKSTYMRAYCYSTYGSVYTGMGKTALADKYNDSALTYYRISKDIPGQCMTLLNLAYNDENRGNFDRSKRRILESYALAKENQQQKSEVAALTALGNHYSMLGQLDSAAAALDRSIALAIAGSDDWGLGNAFLSKGNKFHYLGEYNKALVYYLKSDSIYKLLDWESSRATVINNIGSIYYFQGNYNASLRAFKKANDILERNKLKIDLNGTLWSNIGDVYIEQGFYSDARMWLNKAADFAKSIDDRRTEWAARTYLAKVDFKEGNYDKAAEILQEALQIYQEMDDRFATAAILTELGKVEEKREDRERQYYFALESSKIYAQVGVEKDQWENERLLATYFIAKGQTDSAITHLQHGVNIIENAREKLPEADGSDLKFNQVNNKYEVYNLLITQLIESERVEEAFVYQEKANHTGLKELTRGERGARELDNAEVHQLELKVDGIYKQLLEEKRKPKQEQKAEKIKALEEKLRIREFDLRNYLDSLMKADPDNLVQFSSSINPRDLNAAREDLPDEMALVEFLVSDENTIIFVATYEKLEARVIPVKKAEMEKFVQNFYKQITNKADISQVKNSSAQLYDVLIAPIENLIRDKEQLALVPTGILYKLPFHALLKRNNDTERYLIEDHEVFYVNNLRYIRPSRRRSSEWKLLAFGNADSTLPNAEQEVREIRDLMDSTRIFLKNEAKEDLAKTMMSEYPIVHFATHGNLDPFSFRNSYLTLAPNEQKQEDGKLTIDEIRRISLRGCKLIVLSACNTAVNDDQVEGWVNNPAQEFLLNGAKSVIASLWMVDDAATKQLMISFYTSFKSGEGKSSAIRKAQLEMIKQERFAHPYYWSAFELIGAYN